MKVIATGGNMGRSAVALCVFTLGLLSCKRAPVSESQPAFAIGDWWAESRSNLLRAVQQQKPIVVCVDSEGSVTSERFENDAAQFRSVTKFALLQWFRALKQEPQIDFETKPCRADLDSGALRVVLHYDEQAFQRNIAQIARPTLGVYLIGNGSLYLNMAGVTNVRRDPTRGRKTVLHELGHVFGLHHSTVRGAVMQGNLRDASDHLTSDDVLGIESVWQRIQKQPGQQPSDDRDGGTGVRPITWGELPSHAKDVVLSMRHESWFKVSTAQAVDLTAEQKCALPLGHKLRVKILDNGRATEGHLRVQMVDRLGDCQAGETGRVGFLYQPHID